MCNIVKRFIAWCYGVKGTYERSRNIATFIDKPSTMMIEFVDGQTSSIEVRYTPIYPYTPTRLYRTNHFDVQMVVKYGADGRMHGQVKALSIYSDSETILKLERVDGDPEIGIYNGRVITSHAVLAGSVSSHNVVLLDIPTKIYDTIQVK